MENGVLIGLSRQIALARELDVVANNIANLNTAGYKADYSVFEEFMMPTAQHTQFSGGDRRLSYVQDRTTWRDFRPGGMRLTGNPLDVAIDGDAFLVVQTPRGERYTRNGSLQMDATGQLVTNDGFTVLGESGPIRFQNTDGRISITDEGTITVREGGDTRSDATRGKLRLVRFEQRNRLQKDGNTLFSAPAGVDPLPVQPPQRVRVVQGAIEQSNVQSVLEMSRMIEITRTYTMVSSMLQQHAEMRRGAVDKLADVPA
ncbi:MAG: flagellar basal-body rod protein FlgF [Hyphomicrobiales bacterium]|nr:flagellar basal-body rod protein FlgF [Hyphomicrobiales bacterium]